MAEIKNHKDKSQSVVLLIDCPDRKGLVASVTEFIFKNNGNIITLDQHIDAQKKVFFMRVEWDLEKFSIPREKIGEYLQALVAEKFKMKWRMYFSDETPRMAIFVSKLPHCLFDVLSRFQSGEWNVEVPVIISNHTDMEPVSKSFGIDYHVFQINKDNKKKQEIEQIKLLKKYDIDFIVLARYMQILTEDFVSNYENRIINIHHSFLPAFPGAKPYHSAYERGVKIIGATSHYVTAELDAGPIIEQDVVRVSHKDDVENMVRRGRDLEKVVLSRAITYHLEHKILIHENRTLVFH
ncbi:formyltetrahydrofolate deformylase [Desulfobacterota bacterium AH_259_B03_O07]|nr:formyltetrahydrofolate deformylase [Desulfobacterota bacterium AH_259_B03_O07]